MCENKCKNVKKMLEEKKKCKMVKKNNSKSIFSLLRHSYKNTNWKLNGWVSVKTRTIIKCFKLQTKIIHVLLIAWYSFHLPKEFFHFIVINYYCIRKIDESKVPKIVTSYSSRIIRSLSSIT